MRVSFTGIRILHAVLAGLLLASCGLPSLGLSEGRLRHANPPQGMDASRQQAEIERLVQEQLAALTQSAASLPQPSQTASPQTFPTITSTQPPTPTPSPAPTDTPVPSPSPSASPIPPPDSARLNGFAHLYQNMNNCGPATLAMALSYWGWPEDLEDYLHAGRQRELQDAIAHAIKPEPQDKSVGPQELADYVEGSTSLKALVRAAGDLEIVKRFVSGGLPVIVQRGLDSYVWLGHYQLVSGYEDASQRVFVYDSYLGPSNSIPTPYQELLQDWRAFNYTYLVLYPPERELEVASILGADYDIHHNRTAAVDLAMDELTDLSGRDLFFGWYNLGTSLVALEDYPAAAGAFDQALTMYGDLPHEDRPWRMLWYQTAPYQAYYFTARYADLEALATRTMEEAYEPDKPGGPFIEESFYWRGMALAAMGRTAEAVEDFRKARQLNPLFGPASEELQRLGEQ
jgi:tetratricopeptide (TPR) repeat protein